VKGIVLVVITILVPMQSFAQRGGARGVGRGTGSLVIPPVRVVVPPAPTSNGMGRNYYIRGAHVSGRFGRSGAYNGYGGYGSEGYPYDNEEGYPPPPPNASPNGMVEAPFQNSPPYEPPQGRTQILEFHWTEPPGKPGATYSIVSNDGKTYQADLVWVQDNNVHFFTPDGATVVLPLTSVNRERTSQANAEQNLKLQLY
jgi:hypothetical protein